MQKMQTSIKYESTDAINPLGEFVQSCLDQYEDKQGSQHQYSQIDEQHQSEDFFVNLQEEVKYYGYEDKKSITIKPVKMHKDLISLRKQNQQKKLIIQKLEKQNALLKQKFNSSMMENKKVQQFLKDIQFTFKNDKRSQKANQIMMKTKKMLYRQAQDCQFSAKKLTHSQQAGKVQQLKLYIEFLQKQKLRLKKIVQETKKNNEKLHEEEDFSAQNQQKFQQTLSTVQQWLNVQMLRVKRRQQIYLVEQGMVSTGLKQKEIFLKKKQIQKYYDKLKELLLQKQGQQYEIQVLQKKRKDKLKLIEELKQFKSDIMSKKTYIQQLEKQLKQKLKTFQYMTKWTKQLKVKLQQKKENHINNKILYQKKISALSKQYQQLNKKYKMELAEQQQGIGITNNANNDRKKTVKGRQLGQGKQYINKQKQATSKNTQTLIKKIKIIKLEQIRKIIKRVKVWLLYHQFDIQKLIKENFLKLTDHNNNGIYDESLDIDFQVKKQNKDQFLQSKVSENERKISVKKGYVTNWATNKKQDNQNIISNEIKLSQLIENIKQWMTKQGIAQQNDGDIIKLARYIVEDGQQSIKQPLLQPKKLIKTAQGLVPDVSINKNLALTIMKKLFENQLRSKKQIAQTKQKLKEFLTKNYDPFRLDLLKMLLSLGGLQSLNQSKMAYDTVLSVTQYLAGQKHIESSQMTTMKRNQQLHLQLDLDEMIFMQKLKKHVIAEYYVVRFKQLFDLMIFEQFGEIDRPRLGMFDRICQIITEKKLVKENLNRQFNFNSQPGCEENETQNKKQQMRNKEQKGQNKFKLQFQISKNNQNKQIVTVSKGSIGTEQEMQSSYWIVGREENKKPSYININVDEQENSNEWQKQSSRSNTKKKKSWLDDLMSDDNEDNIKQNPDDSGESYD